MDRIFPLDEDDFDDSDEFDEYLDDVEFSHQQQQILIRQGLANGEFDHYIRLRFVDIIRRGEEQDFNLQYEVWARVDPVQLSSDKEDMMAALEAN
jgi:hypothetical protein